VRIQRAEGELVEIDVAGRSVTLEVPFTQAHLRTNLLAAMAAASAVDVVPSGRPDMVLSAGRGQRLTRPDGVTVIDDCYNANPISMRAAIDDLAETAGGRAGGRAPGRLVAVLGDMLELGPQELDFHAQTGARANAVGVDVLVTVGPLAAAIAAEFTGETHSTDTAADAADLVPDLIRPGDVVLVKASRGVGLELVCRALTAGVSA
jgi:UDP-N-acetylmuramoyl-tripeptide--D-alanyl-D-alanine ligase